MPPNLYGSPPSPAPVHEEHGNYLTWAGGSFKADCFDLPAANRALAKIMVRLSMQLWAEGYPEIAYL